MKIIRKNVLGEVVEETDVSNINIEDTLIIKEKKVFIEKLDIVKKPMVIDVPVINEIHKDIEVSTVKINEEVRKIIIYDFVYEKKRIPIIEEYIVKVPKLVEVDTPVPKIREVDTPIDKPIYNTVVIDKPIFSAKQVDTCVINHICPHCGKKSIDFLKDKND